MTNLALVNAETMVCDNVTCDERPASEVAVAGYIVLDLDTTIGVNWQISKETNEWVTYELIGSGGIGDTWDGQKLVANKPVNQ